MLWINLTFAAPSLGVDYVPFGRADLVWVDEEQSTGTRVGEFDGLIRPSLTPYLLVPRAGAGAEIEVAEGLSVGFRTHLNGWRGQRISEDSYDVSTLMWVDAGLRLQVEL